MEETLSLATTLPPAMSEGILEYLQEIVDDDRLGNMIKLASLSILNKLFNKDADGCIRKKFMQGNFLTSIVSALDNGLSVNCDPSEAVYTSVAMETMWHLSCLPIGNIQHLITVPIIRRLLTYLNVDSEVYRFSSTLTNQMRDLSQDKHLIGQVKVLPMETERLEYIHRHTRNVLHKLPKLTDKFHVCSLFDTSSDEDVNITQTLLDNKLIWPGKTEDCVTHGDNLDAEAWKDIWVTEVLDGAMFWAQIGEDCIQLVAKIQDTLNREKPLDKHVRPRKGQEVVVQRSVCGKACYMRAQVLSSVGGDSMDVFAVDFGHIFSVSYGTTYTVPDHLCLSVCPGQISLCSLANLQAPPHDEELVVNAAAILANFCKQSVHVGDMVRGMGRVTDLTKLLMSSTACPSITRQILTVLHNLVCNPQLTQHMLDIDTVRTILDVMAMFPDEKDDHLVLSSCLSILTTMLWKSCEAKQLFYENQGIDAVLWRVSRIRKGGNLYRQCVKLLKNFIGMALTSTETQPELELTSSPWQHNKAQSRLNRDCARGKARTTDVSQVNMGRKSDPVEQTIHHSRLLQGKEDSESDSSDTEDEDVIPIRGNTDGLTQDLVHLDIAGLDQTGSKKYYILGSKVKFTDDRTHELRPNSMASKVSASSIAEHVCAMLNTGKGGTVYYGIDKDSIVFGLHMSRDEKDQFRLGIDQLMHNKISPILLHFQFDLQDIPVVRYHTGDQGHPRMVVIPDLFVLEISARPSKGVIYTVLGTKSCFYRFEHESNAISRSELRQLVVLKEEHVYEDRLQRLTHERDQLRQEIVQQLALA